MARFGIAETILPVRCRADQQGEHVDEPAEPALEDCRTPGERDAPPVSLLIGAILGCGGRRRSRGPQPCTSERAAPASSSACRVSSNTVWAMAALLPREVMPSLPNSDRQPSRWNTLPRSRAGS